MTKTSHAFIAKPVDEWTTLDIHLFYAHAEDVAADGDLAVKRPALREIALEIVGRKQLYAGRG